MTATITVEGHYVVKAGRELNFSDDAFYLDQVEASKPAYLRNDGVVTAQSGSQSLYGVQTDGLDLTQAAVFANTADASFSVISTFGFAIGGYFDFTHTTVANDGAFHVSGQTDAVGIICQGQLDFRNGGDFTVESASSATGVKLNGEDGDVRNEGFMTVSGGDDLTVGIWAFRHASILNTGTLTVSSGEQAIGILAEEPVNSLRNDGLIVASSEQGVATGLQVSADFDTIENIGSIIAEGPRQIPGSFGIFIEPAAVAGGTHTIDNSGSIEARFAIYDIAKGAGAADILLRNSGGIDGAVRLGQGPTRSTTSAGLLARSTWAAAATVTRPAVPAGCSASSRALAATTS